MPVEITISAIYWPLILLAPQLMLPPDLARAPDADVTAAAAGQPLVFLPLWMDLGLHAVPAAALIIGESEARGDVVHAGARPTSTSTLLLLKLLRLHPLPVACGAPVPAMLAGASPRPDGCMAVTWL
jgi:hypothetical protein